MASSIDYRLYRAGDAAAISALYEAAFGQPQSAALWRWHFEENPCGPSHIVIAEEGGRCIGHYAVSPMPMADRGHDFVAWIGIDHMVAPGFQGRGVYGGMEKYARATLTAVRPSYAFPNELSFPVFTGKFGWSSLGSVRTSIRPGGLAGLRRRFRPAACLVPGSALVDVLLGRPRGRYEVAEVERFGPEFDELWGALQGVAGCIGPPHVALPQLALRAEPRALSSVCSATRRRARRVCGDEDRGAFRVLDRLGDGFARAVRRKARTVSAKRCASRIPGVVGVRLLGHPGTSSGARTSASARRLPTTAAVATAHKFWFVVKRENHPDDRISRLDGWYLTWGVNDVP